MPLSRPALYREVLTPALHRRFTGSALIVLVLCYFVGILIGEKTSFLWLWFPLGSAGIRSLLLFVCTLAVFILRIGSVHLGGRTSSASTKTFLFEACRLGTIQTFAWYLFSAWWFSEVYIWSAPASAELGWVKRGNSMERDKLNERAIYIRTFFMQLALWQSVLHLLGDYNLLPLSITPSKGDPLSQQPQGTLQWLSSWSQILIPMLKWDATSYARSVAQNVFMRSLFISLLYPLLYGLFIRRTAWTWSWSFANLMWGLPLQRLSFIPPHYPSLVYRTFVAGLQLVFLWQSANALFTAYVSRQPVKSSQPLSADSKDPIGTLLNGLKSKKEIPKTFATWELSILTANFPDRRKAIFTDIDRPSGAAWSQVLIASMGNISSINDRISAFLKPPSPPSTTSNQTPAPIESLPRISTPLQQGNIFARSPPPSTALESIETNIGNLAKSYGQSPHPGTLTMPSLSPQTKSSLSNQSQNLLSSPTAQRLLAAAPSKDVSPTEIRSLFNDYLTRFLRSPLGHPFRQTFARRVTAVVLGTPYSTYCTTICSIKALSALAVASIDEDPYGRVCKDVPALIRIYTSTIETVEAFVANLPPHWTDVTFSERERWVSDVADVMSCLKDGLRDLLDAFGKYAGELGLAESEMRVARKASEVRARESELEAEKPAEGKEMVMERRAR